jgi:hypothetical protein
MNAIKGFVVRYCEQHAHPINAPLHLIGVPMVGVGLLRLVTHQPGGWALILVGYVLQWVGHSIHGTEVGEVTLAKKIWRGLAHRHEE